MIVYDTGHLSGLRDLPRIHGSALYKSVLPSLFSTALLVLLEYASALEGGEQRLSTHPYAVGGFIAFFSIMLTFRLKMAYGRYWSAATSVHQMLIKWLNCSIALAAFHYSSKKFEDIYPPSFGQNQDLKRKDINGYQRNFELSYEETIQMIEDSQSQEKKVVENSWWRRLLKCKHPSLAPPSMPGKKKSINSVLYDMENAPNRIPIPIRFQQRFEQAASNPSSRSLLRTRLVKQSRAEVNWSTHRQFKVPKPTLFLQELAHLFSFLSAVAMATLRNDNPNCEFPLTEYVPGMPWPPVDPDELSKDIRREYGADKKVKNVIYFLLGLSHSQTHRTLYNAARPFSVLGGVSDDEMQRLKDATGPSAKVSLVTMWIEEFISREFRAGSAGDVASPIVSLLYQYVSDGSAGYDQARKTAYIPFPFVHYQITTFFSFIILFIFPILFYGFAKNMAFFCILNFVTVMCFHGLHEVAREMEDPFINTPNDLPLTTFQAQFNEALVTMYAGFHPDSWWEVKKDMVHSVSEKVTVDEKKCGTN